MDVGKNLFLFTGQEEEKNNAWQAFYTDILKTGYREERFLELAKKEGVPIQKAERLLKDKKVPPHYDAQDLGIWALCSPKQSLDSRYHLWSSAFLM